jgi:hypothetical protein
MRDIIGTAQEVGTGLLDKGPFYLFSALIIYSPFHYALTTPTGLSIFTQVAYLAFFLFLWDCLIKDTWPQIPLLPLACFGLILIQGWWMTFNAGSYYRWHDELITIRVLSGSPMPDLPGSYERFGSAKTTSQLTGLFGLILIFFNLPAHRKHRLLFLMLLSITGCAALGIAMKFSEPLKQLYWPLARYEHADMVKNVFAGFRYHAHAASFMMFGLCLAGGLWLHGIPHRTTKRERSVCAVAFFVIIIGLLMNTSRAGWLMAPLVVVGLGISGCYWFIRAKIFSSKNLILTCLSIALVGSIFVFIFGAEKNVRTARLENLSGDMGKRSPTQIFEQMIPDTPRFGFGPASFPFVFPKYQLENPHLYRYEKFLNAAHQDYYQYFFEWGPVGAAAFLALLLAPFYSAVRGRSESRWQELLNPLPHASLVAVALCAMHALFDFPLQVVQLQLCFLLCWAVAIDRQAEEPPHSPA